MFLIVLVMPGVSGQAMVVMRAEDGPVGLLIVQDIEQPLIAKEVAILLRVTRGQVRLWLGQWVVESGLTRRHVR